MSRFSRLQDLRAFDQLAVHPQFAGIEVGHYLRAIVEGGGLRFSLLCVIDDLVQAEVAELLDLAGVWKSTCNRSERAGR